MLGVVCLLTAILPCRAFASVLPPSAAPEVAAHAGELVNVSACIAGQMWDDAIASKAYIERHLLFLASGWGITESWAKVHSYRVGVILFVRLHA